jgi:tRNA threonylcarbamoyladenosine biosynthesis protein TsaE
MDIVSCSVRDTLETGKAIAAHLKGGEIICLFGEFGSGKTVLTKGIAEGLGINKAVVVSPSFVIIRQHLEGKLPLYHLDLYRMRRESDIMGLGYEEYLYGKGVTVIEWAEKLKNLLPKEYLSFKLFVKGKRERLIKCSAFGCQYEKLLESINIKTTA